MAAFSRQGLERFRHGLAWHVESGQMPGLVALVSHGDTVHVETIGSLAFDDTAPMQRDTIFRIASITKPIVAVATMMLVEECRLRLDDSIEPWLPELANRRVLKAIGSELDDTVAAKRAITLRDLLTYRMGFGSVMAMPGRYPIQRAIRDFEIGGDGPPRPDRGPGMDEWLRRLGTLPLMAQPGERWMYNTSADVLGALIARVSDMPLSRFLRERIFDPLGMKDTSFRLPAERALPGVYFRNPETNALEEYDDRRRSAWLGEPHMESGAGGLLSTADDYFLFCRMMQKGGKAGTEQIISPATVELMTSDQLTAGQREGAELFFGDYSSWGLGVAVDIARREIYHSPGRFGWTGGFGTTAYTDPRNGVIGILMTQRMMESPDPPKVFTDFWTLAYGAVV